MKTLKDISFYIVIGFIVYIASYYLKSSFLDKFYKDNLITILLALLAINTTTSSVVMTKLKEISEKNQVNFESTIAELKCSLFEQVGMLIVGIVFLILDDSSLVLAVFPNCGIVYGGILTATFVGSIYNLYDTAASIFVILKFENK